MQLSVGFQRQVTSPRVAGHRKLRDQRGVEVRRALLGGAYVALSAKTVIEPTYEHTQTSSVAGL